MIALLAVLSALATTDDAPAPPPSDAVVVPVVATPAPAEPAATIVSTTKTTSTTPPSTTPTTARPDGKLVKRSIAATQWPLEPALSAGFLWSNVATVPWIGFTAFVPVIPGLGPTVLVRGAGASTGVASYYEGFVGIGVGFEGKLGDLRARASLVPSVQLSSVDDGSGAVSGLGPAMLAPLELGLPLGGGVSFTGTVEPGIATEIEVAVGDEVVTGRDRFFVLVGAGITFGGPVD